MRIVFEFVGKPAVLTTGRAKSLGPVKKRPRWNGCQAEMVIDDVPESKRAAPGDVLHLEGDVDALRYAFRIALEQLDLLEASERKRADAVIARSSKCPTCRTWRDPQGRWHTDGKGNVCSASAAPPDED